MKKKLLSIFVMLLMTVTSVLAQQVVETGVIDEFVQTETFNTTGGNDELPYSCQGNGVDINGSRWLSGGLQINYNEMVGITAHSGVKIVKVDLRYGEGSAGSSYTSTTAGELKGKSIVNAYADELTITNSYHHNSGVMVVVDQIKVYYVKVSQSDQEESYSRTSYGTHFAVEGSEYNNGSTKCWNIAYLSKSNPLTVNAKNGERIKKVGFWYDPTTVDVATAVTMIESSLGSVSVDEANHCISVTDIANATSLTISTTFNSAHFLIRSFEVYYDVVESTVNVAARLANDAYWSTFYSDKANYQASEGTQVFKVNLDGTALTMTEVENRIVTKEQGVVLKSNTDNITMAVTKESSSDDYSGNSLRGTGVSIINPGGAYVLNCVEPGGVGFYKLSSTGTIKENKAYLYYDGSSAAREFFGFAETTGIELNKVEANEDKMYDLQGRHVTNPVNGIYIVNGKKVIKK